MIKISKWARLNPKSSRFIIALCHFLVVINAICFGALMYIFDWEGPRWLLVIAANIFFISYVRYPKLDKKKSKNVSLYVRQKAHDFTLVFFYSIVISLGVNNYIIHNNNDYSTVQRPTAKLVVYELKPENNTSNKRQHRSAVKGKIKKLRKQIKHELRKLKKELKRKNDKAGVIALKILLSLLTVGASLILGYLVAALACNLSCSGQEGLAAVVLILGIGGVIWLMIITLNNILKKVGQKKKKPISSAY
ncbi:MAG: hypothetical protein AB8F74_05650 [Saprospiraceae bacterium]